MKVLLVDDQTQFVSVLTRRLNMRGIDAVCVYSPDEALNLTDTTRFDIAVLDMKMPGMNGIELRRRLHQKNPTMKFIFLTGHGSEADFLVGSAEATFFLPKPLNIDKLIEAIKQTASGEIDQL
jgi:DNA-binding response OmpR family regulator